MDSTNTQNQQNQHSPDTSQTYRQKLDAGEQHWMWKLGLRAILIVTGIIGIGCMAWAVAAASKDYYGYLDDRYMICWTLITFGASVIWCLICILILLLRRPPRPAHPGVAVGMDLILWLAFIPTCLFAILAAISVLDFGSNGYIDQYGAYGYYYHADNGTWVYNHTEYATYFQKPRECDPSSSYYSYDMPTCAEQDAYVNNLWKSKPHRAGVEITGTVCQFIGFVLHFTLFVWACVDTHRRNSQKTSKEAEILAANIVMNMVRSGTVVPQQQQYMSQQPLLHPQHMQQPAIGGFYGGPQYTQQPMMAGVYDGGAPQGAPQSPVGNGDRKDQSQRFA